MSEIKVCCSKGPAMAEAAEYLRRSGTAVTEQMEAGVTHYLLPVPTRSFDALPTGVVIVGGNLHCLPGYETIDLLKDPAYLAENAAITARCAIPLLGRDLRGLPVLILGWGRIGKCLTKFLTEAGAVVTVAARNPADVALARAMGHGGVALDKAAAVLPEFGAVINTIPAMVLPAFRCGPDCRLLELASRPGMAGSGIIDGRGLPGKYAPAESGALIARRLLALAKEGRP